MSLAIIAALGTHDRCIGIGGKLPWRLPEDLKVFKALTMGRPVIMGRKTFESIGRPLPGRENIVLSRSGLTYGGAIPDKTILVRSDSLESALMFAREVSAEVPCVIGGAEIYRLALPLAGVMSLTFVDQDTPNGDTFFPEVDWSEWCEVGSGIEAVTFKGTFREYVRKAR